MHGLRRLVGTLGLFGLLAAGCQPTRSALPQASATPTAAQTPVAAEPLRAPLTWLPLADDSSLTRPVLAAKIGNSEAERPQAGLSAADIVFELLVDRDQTRFVALFHSSIPKVVGPLRSTRLTDAPLVAPYNALYTAEAADGRIQAAMRAFGVVPVLPQDTPEAFFRDETPGGSLRAGKYALTPALLAAVHGRVPPGQAVEWPFDARLAGRWCGDHLDPDACRTSPARLVQVELLPGATIAWRYDAKTGVYRRFQDGEAHTDADGRPITAANVVLIPTAYRFHTCCEDLDAPLAETEVIGDGQATLLRDGRRIPARWTKADPGRHLRLLTAGGQPLAMKPGRTWVELVPVRPSHDRGVPR